MMSFNLVQKNNCIFMDSNTQPPLATIKSHLNTALQVLVCWAHWEISAIEAQQRLYHLKLAQTAPTLNQPQPPSTATTMTQQQ